MKKTDRCAAIPRRSGMVAVVLRTFFHFEGCANSCFSFSFVREEENLDELSKLGHFLKGSSATLGLTKIKDSCEKIQRYGKKEKEDGSPLDDEKVCLEKITSTLKVVKEEYEEAEKILNDFFKTSESSTSDS